MKYWVGVTDNTWFEYLRREGPDEVNFWQPSGRPPFVNLPPGALFLFKLKDPFNHIAGGGYFVKFSALPLSMAWEAFGTKNGAPSREHLEAMIRRLARDKNSRDPMIGCTILAEPFFWPESEWIDVSSRWSPNVVRGRYYETEREDGSSLLNALHERHHSGDIVAEAAARYGTPTLVRPRLGQGAFQVMVLDAYQRRCAITGEQTLPVLEAAHILPYRNNGPHELANGMLLRSDFHKLFDKGLVTVTPELRIAISSKIREQWFNGKVYYRLNGQALANLPLDPRDQPDPSYLRWHNENCFVE